MASTGALPGWSDTQDVSHLKAEVKQGTLPLARQEASLTILSPLFPAGTRKTGCHCWGLTLGGDREKLAWSGDPPHVHLSPHTSWDLIAHASLGSICVIGRYSFCQVLRFRREGRYLALYSQSPVSQQNRSQPISARGRSIYDLFTHSFSHQQIILRTLYAPGIMWIHEKGCKHKMTQTTIVLVVK